MNNFINTPRSKKQVFLVICMLGIFLATLSGCLQESSELETTSTPAGSQEAPANPDWYSIYFTDPTASSAKSFRGGPDAQLAKAIAAARASVDVAVYDLNLWSIRDALIEAYRRGITVRVVTESDNLDEVEIQDLKNEGIPVLGDRREGLMHHKFVILDRQEVWTGSMNFTTTDGYLNDNHLIRVLSPVLAEDYTTEFEEMFDEDLFGPDSRADTPEPVLEIGGTEVEVYFSPDDGTQRRLLELINGAEESIYFLAFSFTSDPLAEALLKQAGEGVVVVGVFEESQVASNIGGEYERLLEAGLDVRLDGNLRNMHHKVIIIDERIVVLGSYNFSKSAETRNDENTLILHDETIAAEFSGEFERIFNSSHR